jgi:HAD superfamily hydrolase (TIGR01484 family)
MQPLASMTAAAAQALRGVFTDIDGTLTDAGKLGAPAYDALWRLRDAGLRVVPVTGRPAGWCDLIAREWPVDGVVGENGALAYWEAGGKLERYYHPAASRGSLDAIREAILREVPGARVAKDQAFRMFDLAIDFCEEPPDLGAEGAEKIRAVFAKHGAHAKISNIHVNGWLGDYDKVAMMRLFARERWGEELDAARARYVFAGDSPNDEPAFAYFPNAVGVANVRDFAPSMRSLPAWVTDAPGGAGFAEMAARVLALRR